MSPPARALALALLVVAISSAQNPPAFRYARELTPAAPGPNRALVDLELLAGAQPLRYEPPLAGGLPAGRTPRFAGGLEDLRLYDPAGRELPYLLIPPAASEPEWRDGLILPVASTRKASGFELDLGATLPIDAVRLEGLPAPFLKRVRLEGGGDRSHWTLLIDEGTLFDLPAERLERTELVFAPGSYRYLRITWDDRSSGRLPLPERARARRAASSLPPPAARAALEFERRASEPGKSRFRIHLPGPRLPLVGIGLKVADGDLLRRARVVEGRLSVAEVVPVVLGEKLVRRALRDALVAEDLDIPIRAPEGADLDLVVEDADNPPLQLEGVEAILAPLPWIYFESAAGERLTARFGARKLARPRYDLEAAREAAARSAPATASWGPRAAAWPAERRAGAELPAYGAQIDSSRFRYARALPAGPAELVALTLDAQILARSRSLADLRIVDHLGRQVPYLLERRDEPLEVQLAPLRRLPDQPDRWTRYLVSLPEPGLPPSRLVLRTGARIFDRALQIEMETSARRTRERRAILASGRWRHADQDRAAPELVLHLPKLPVTELTLALDEGDNQPLAFERPRLLLAAYRLRFFRAAGAELLLLYGQPELAAPRYDLALLARELLGASALEIAPGPETQVPSFRDPGRRPRLLFYAALGLAVVILLLLMVRLLRPRGAPVGPRDGSSA